MSQAVALGKHILTLEGLDEVERWNGLRHSDWPALVADGRLTSVKARMVGDSGAYVSVGICKTLRTMKPHHDAALRAGREVGVDCAVMNMGIGNGVVEHGKARLVVGQNEHSGRITLYIGFTKMGQGMSTALVQLAVECTGLPMSFKLRAVGVLLTGVRRQG
jgi:hypothetical protein